jgi:hypothetical protein
MWYSKDTNHVIMIHTKNSLTPVAYPGFILGGGLRQDFFFQGWGSTNSVEDRGQREWGSGGSSPLVSGSTQFANE